MLYKISYKVEGCVSVDANSEQEAKDDFYDLNDSEILDNSFVGVEITDIREE